MIHPQNLMMFLEKKGMGTSYVAKFEVMFWVHNLMPGAKYEEDNSMPSKVMANSNFEKTENELASKC